MVEAPRFERRRGSRRARARSAREKTDKFLTLRAQGANRAAIAAALGFPGESIDELIEIAREGEGEGSS